MVEPVGSTTSFMPKHRKDSNPGHKGVRDNSHTHFGLVNVTEEMKQMENWRRFVGKCKGKKKII